MWMNQQVLYLHNKEPMRGVFPESPVCQIESTAPPWSPWIQVDIPKMTQKCRIAGTV